MRLLIILAIVAVLAGSLGESRNIFEKIGDGVESIKDKIVDKVEDGRDKVIEGVADKAIGDALGTGGETTEQDLGKENGKYKGGFAERMAHSVTDAAIDEAKNYAIEKAPNDMAKPVIEVAAKHVDKKAHQLVNENLGGESPPEAAPKR